MEHVAELAASAISGGLANARLRSSPVRLVEEAKRFVKLLAAATAEKTAPARMLGRELRVGALAGADIGELERIFAVWRRTLDVLPIERSEVLWSAFETVRAQAADVSAHWSPHRIDYVMVGASAGGIPALRGFLSGFDATFPAAMMIVLHVGEKTPSVLPSILRRLTKLTIAFAVDGADPFRGFAYVAPTGRHLTLIDGKLRLAAGGRVRYARPSIDVLLASAAAARSKVASVILSGTGSDGADGTCAIHSSGGLTMAQDPATAEFAMMPQRTIDTGEVDYVASPRRLAELLKIIICEGRRPRAA